MKAATSLAALALIPLAFAQSPTVVSLYLMNSDPQSLVASVISADASTTLYEITCPTNVDGNDCGYRPPITIKHAGSVYGGGITTNDFTMSYECTLYTNGVSSAVCAESAGGTAANFPGVSTATIEASDITLLPVTIIAGQEELGKTVARATATSSTSGSKITSTGTAATAASTGSTTASGTQAATSTSGSEKVAAGCGGLLIVVALAFFMA
ncbi:hypothetical protein EJ08DRAFT_694291 [Tothia fuscella]|uniref:Uncharacterized protein n=1 Tax=Tothia fuscella TaxID=1048955 RepID=A0A9P4NY53_9PEZI|nr:hypothetical protein EJ08DRAFT_694291 [Tothia fuscella]